MMLHLLLAGSATAVIWLLSGILIEATDRVAKRYNKPGFFVAFFILGTLTSISEISVVANATLQGIPEISAGNLIGASIVILLLIIPLVAVAGDGIEMHLAMPKRNLAMLMATMTLPALFALDGTVSPNEGLLMLLAYGILLYAVQKQRPSEEVVEETVQQVEEELLHKHKATAVDVGKILLGTIMIFYAGRILVEEAIFFSETLHVRPSFVGLMLLSVGTNIPELAIALRCVRGSHKHIAFGDYLGSIAANTLLFGLLSLLNGNFSLPQAQFVPAFMILLPGALLFYRFSVSKQILSRKEGLVLLMLYSVFLVIQGFNLATGEASAAGVSLHGII